jgi:hypothetical protein
LCVVRAESVSAIYLVEATNVGVTYLDRLERLVMVTFDRGHSAGLDTVSTTRGAALLSLGRAEVF